MSSWDAGQYLKFERQRTQPAMDLAMRVRSCVPRRIADIGCGPGNSTAVLREVFPDAAILGIDSSPEMIERAHTKYPGLAFRLCDALSLEGGYDLLFSNACLQWIAHHDTLIPALMQKLVPGGVLAVQIPINGEEPLFRLIQEIADEPQWGFHDVPLQPNEALTPEEYYNVLSGCSASFELWETKYYHSLPDHKALVEWVKGTRIRPYLACLDKEQGAAFEAEILKGAKALYPVMQNGCVVLGFRRLFFVASV